MQTNQREAVIVLTENVSILYYYDAIGLVLNL